MQLRNPVNCTKLHKSDKLHTKSTDFQFVIQISLWPLSGGVARCQIVLAGDSALQAVFAAALGDCRCISSKKEILAEFAMRAIITCIVLI